MFLSNNLLKITPSNPNNPSKHQKYNLSQATSLLRHYFKRKEENNLKHSQR